MYFSYLAIFCESQQNIDDKNVELWIKNYLNTENNLSELLNNAQSDGSDSDLVFFYDRCIFKQSHKIVTIYLIPTI